MPAREHAATADVNAGTLNHWASRLKRKAPTGPTLVEIAFGASSMTAVMVGDAMMRVPSGLDRSVSRWSSMFFGATPDRDQYAHPSLPAAA